VPGSLHPGPRDGLRVNAGNGGNRSPARSPNERDSVECGAAVNAAREGASGMAASPSRAGAATPAKPAAARAAVLGRLTVPGRPEYVHETRTFVAKALGDLHPSLDDAVLLTSELVTNAVTHTGSRAPGGTVTVVVAESSGGVRIEVADGGSDLCTPVVRGEVYAADGHGLQLVQNLSDQWGYLRDEAGTTVWFWLAAS
jgi:anti-sigma regulatory factor (Ser/Thr protein kinase)